MYLREGSSDDGLLEHFEVLLVAAGVDEARGERRDYGGSVRDKLARLVAEDIHLDAVFVHRDADSAGPEARLEEMQLAADTIDGCPRVIPVVPVRTTEAWLLGDEGAIREVAGNPTARNPLGLPPLKAVEDVAKPKELLAEVLAEASGCTGSALGDFNNKFGRHRATLLERLDLYGPVSHLASWQSLVTAIGVYVAERFEHEK